MNVKAATFLWTALESSDGTRIFRRRHNIAGGDGLPANVKIFQLSGDTHSKILRRRGWQPAAPGAAGNSKWRRQERRVDTRTCNSLTVQFNEQHSTSLTSKLYFTSVYMGVGYYALDLILMWLITTKGRFIEKMLKHAEFKQITEDFQWKILV